MDSSSSVDQFISLTGSHFIARLPFKSWLFNVFLLSHNINMTSGCSKEVAEKYLEKHNVDMNRAVSAYFDDIANKQTSSSSNLQDAIDAFLGSTPSKYINNIIVLWNLILNFTIFRPDCVKEEVRAPIPQKHAQLVEDKPVYGK